ncbi:hypothetical protein RB195_007401 [Necator americanus]|uniref:Uncharacterized protein n=2 Tax=Necator americanus TaxID=51031 RepID=A0ABR1BYP2_NECAM|nr:hypothetical protein NECAME_05263 [Necator americanus]ETN69408.1 hypothetical protein NECAME_05263 [Necator americanus]
MLRFLQLLIVVHLVECYEELPGYTSGARPELNYDGRKLKFGMGSIKDSDVAASYMQIPVGDGSHLRVPKAFYHYTERDAGADAGWGIPSDGRLMSLNSMVKNNRKEINGMFLPLPNMDPINLHFITQRTFEKGIDTSAHDQESTLEAAKRVCLTSSEIECEKALLHYHRTKAQSIRERRRPLYQQLMNLGDLTSYSTLRDREGKGMGVVVGVPGYDPLYVGAALDSNKDSNLGLRFSPPQ